MTITLHSRACVDGAHQITPHHAGLRNEGNNNGRKNGSFNLSDKNGRFNGVCMRAPDAAGMAHACMTLLVLVLLLRRGALHVLCVLSERAANSAVGGGTVATTASLLPTCSGVAAAR